MKVCSVPLFLFLSPPDKTATWPRSRTNFPDTLREIIENVHYWTSVAQKLFSHQVRKDMLLYTVGIYNIFVMPVDL